MSKPSYWRAKFASPCKLCGVYFTIGEDYIGQVATGGYAHQECIELPIPIATNSSNGARLPVAPVVARAPVATVAPVAPVVERVFSPSPEQQTVKDTGLATRRHIVVNATAGSGKTTMGIWYLGYAYSAQYAPGGDISALDVAFLAFGKDIATVLESRVPKGVHASTFHSLGKGNIERAFPRLKVDKDPQYGKVSRILDGIIPFPERDNPQFALVGALRAVLARLADMARTTLTDPANRSAVTAMADRYNIALDAGNIDDDSLVIELTERAYTLLPEVVAACRTDRISFDFADMIDWPATGIVPCKRFDLLLVDEAQDASAARVEFVLRSIKPNGQVIAIGDKWQSIMGFTGADVDAMPNFVRRLGAIELPLNVSWRIPESHAELARTICPTIRARDGAPVGVLTSIKQGEIYKQVQPGDMILCRVNAPLVPMAFQLIRRGIKATVRGRDIGRGLIELADKVNAGDLNGMLDKLKVYRGREVARLQRKDASELKIQAIEDKCDTLECIIAECDKPADVAAKINALFSDKVQGVVLSSCHRSKGLEAKNVYLLRPDLLPFPKATRPWEVEQETFLQFVAYTRSRYGLYFVESDE